MRLLWEMPRLPGRRSGPRAKNRRLDTAPMQADILECCVIQRPQLRQRCPALMPGPNLTPEAAQELPAQVFRPLYRRALQQAVTGRCQPPVVQNEKFQI